MTTWYGFQKPELSADPMNVTERVPDEDFSATIKDQVQQQFDSPKVNFIPCCTKTQPCPTWIQFKPQLGECPTTFMSWGELTNGQYESFEVGQKDSRIWVGSLQAPAYNRRLISGAEWEAESTRGHIRARQGFAQYLQSTLFPNTSPHEKSISRVADSYGAIVHRMGPPQFTTF